MENEKKEEAITQSDVIPGARYRDDRPTDLEIFYQLLPGTLAGLAGKSGDARSANAMTLLMVREMLGQCVAMGIMRQTVRCLDGSALAILPAGMQAVAGIPGVSQPVQQPTQAGQGGLVSQYSNYPGQGQPAQGPGVGGMVSQHPSYGAQPQPQQPGRGGPVPGQTSNIQPVMQFPNGATPPQL